MLKSFFILIFVEVKMNNKKFIIIVVVLVFLLVFISFGMDKSAPEPEVKNQPTESSTKTENKVEPKKEPVSEIKQKIKNDRNAFFRKSPDGELISKVRKGSEFGYISSTRVDGADWYEVEYDKKRGYVHSGYFDLDRERNPLNIKNTHKYEMKEVAKIKKDEAMLYYDTKGKAFKKVKKDELYYFEEKTDDKWSKIKYGKKKYYIKSEDISVSRLDIYNYIKVPYMPEKYLRKQASLDPVEASGFEPYSSSKAKYKPLKSLNALSDEEFRRRLDGAITYSLNYWDNGNGCLEPVPYVWGGKWLPGVQKSPNASKEYGTQYAAVGYGELEGGRVVTEKKDLSKKNKKGEDLLVGLDCAGQVMKSYYDAFGINLNVSLFPQLELYHRNGKVISEKDFTADDIDELIGILKYGDIINFYSHETNKIVHTGVYIGDGLSYYNGGGDHGSAKIVELKNVINVKVLPGAYGGVRGIYRLKK